MMILRACLVTSTAITLAILPTACSTKIKSGDPSRVSEKRAKPFGPPLKFPNPPLGLPPVPLPMDNPPTTETVALGRKLFYDKRLSFDNSISCATCHNPALSFTDGHAHSSGASGKTGLRNAPTVLNAAYEPAQFWDGRAKTLEEQVGGPMANIVEMNQPHEVAVSKLNADPELRKEFEKAFGPGKITLNKIEQSIASFERTLLSGDSAFDRYAYGGDKKAMSPGAIRGFEVFKDPKRGNCASCHLVSSKYALFTDGLFHNLGVGVNDEGQLTDLGRYSETKREADKGAFKTPTLRNVALTAPYMHDGGLKTLKEVVDFYAGRGNSNPYLDKRISTITLTGKDRADLVEFLETLTSSPTPDSGPPSSSAE
jgi:cytochrome c peroxidase